ncbi:YwqH-like family protein [Peribacillus cavernae]|uniref:YwqH-like family protein n=1 Tax=Peribacillus cavernae TaxID=1674310 RepID=UPI0026BC4210
MFESSLASLNRSLYEMQEELRRLLEIKPGVEKIYQEFIMNYPYCMEPSLSSNTWNGKVASIFNEFRESEMKDNYNNILNEQFPMILFMLQNKIKELSVDIENLYSSIAVTQMKEQEAKAKEQ